MLNSIISRRIVIWSYEKPLLIQRSFFACGNPRVTAWDRQCPDQLQCCFCECHEGRKLPSVVTRLPTSHGQFVLLRFPRNLKRENPNQSLVFRDCLRNSALTNGNSCVLSIDFSLLYTWTANTPPFETQPANKIKVRYQKAWSLFSSYHPGTLARRSYLDTPLHLNIGFEIAGGKYPR